MPVIVDTAIGPVTMIEMWEDFKKGIDIQRGPYVEQSYITPGWLDTDALINALMGSTATSGSSTVHIPGFRCPTSPNLTCIDAYVQGEAEYDAHDGGHVQFNIPKIRVVYGIRTWEQFATDDPQGMNSFPGQGPTTYAIHTMDFGTESIKLPTSAYRFKTADSHGNFLPVDVPIVRHIGTCTLNVELKKVPYLPTITVLKLIGKVNDALFFGAPKGQVLFLGARTSKEFESDGTRVQNVSYTFKFRAWPWNMFLRPDDGTFDIIWTPGHIPPYEYADLRPLIVLEGFAGMGTLPVIDT